MTQTVQGKASVGAKELTAVFTVFTASHGFLGYPRYATEVGYEAAWMMPLIAGAVCMLVFWLADGLMAKHFPGMDIIEIAKTYFGKMMASAIAVLIVLYLLVTSAMVFREFGENVVSTVLPFTPIFLVGALALFAAWYIAYTGLEGIARTAYILFPILVIGVLSLSLLTMNWWHPAWLLPLWGSGVPAVLLGGLKSCSIFMNVLLLCIVYPHAHDTRDLRRVGLVSIGASSLFIAMFIFTYNMVFPEPESPPSPFPLYQLARMIYIGRYLQRLESIYVFLWVTAALAKLAVSLWAMCYILASTFDWPSFRPGLPAMTLMCFSLGMFAPNVGSILQFYDQYFMYWGGLLSLGIPMGILLVAVLVKSVARGVRHA